MSFMLGLPSNIRLENCDTKAPRNLLDSDFDVDTKVLPEARSEHEATRLLWFIVKVRQMPNFSKASMDALSFTENSEAEILALDQDIRQMYTTIPDVLRTRPLCESLVDEPFLIMTRLYVEFIYLKSICVLHRRYMVRGDIFSTKCCIEAGTRIVSKFIEMYREFSPGGQLCTERWMLSNFTVNDVLLGIMVLCLVLYKRRKDGFPTPSTDDETNVDSTVLPTINESTEREILGLLEQAHAILVEKSQASRDVRRVSHAIRLTLRGAFAADKPSSLSVSFSSHETSNAQDLQPPVSKSLTPAVHALPLETIVDSVNRVSLTSYPLEGLQPRAQSQVLSTPLQADRTGHAALPFGALDPFNFMTDVENIDWSEFDPGFEPFDQPFDASNIMGYIPP
jgi:hypothetical protein